MTTLFLRTRMSIMCVHQIKEDTKTRTKLDWDSLRTRCTPFTFKKISGQSYIKHVRTLYVYYVIYV